MYVPAQYAPRSVMDTPASRPSPPGGLRPALTPAAGGTPRHRSRRPNKEDQQSKIRPIEVSTVPGDCRGGSLNRYLRVGDVGVFERFDPRIRGRTGDECVTVNHHGARGYGAPSPAAPPRPATLRWLNSSPNTAIPEPDYAPPDSRPYGRSWTGQPGSQRSGSAGQHGSTGVPARTAVLGLRPIRPTTPAPSRLVRPWGPVRGVGSRRLAVTGDGDPRHGGAPRCLACAWRMPSSGSPVSRAPPGVRRVEPPGGQIRCSRWRCRLAGLVWPVIASGVAVDQTRGGGSAR
jgi:hypothetical protein